MPFKKDNIEGSKHHAGGRKPKRETQYTQWVEQNPGKVTELLETLYEAGVKGDREAAIYVIDRILGRPRAQQDIKLEGVVGVLTPQYLELARERLLEAKARTKELVEGHKEPINEDKQPSISENKD